MRRWQDDGLPWVRYAPLLPLAALLTGCPAGGALANPECYADPAACDGSGAGGMPSGAVCDPVPFFQASCLSSFCHGTLEAAPLDPLLVNLVFQTTPQSLGPVLLDLP